MRLPGIAVAVAIFSIAGLAPDAARAQRGTDVVITPSQARGVDARATRVIRPGEAVFADPSTGETMRADDALIVRPDTAGSIGRPILLREQLGVDLRRTRRDSLRMGSRVDRLSTQVAELEPGAEALPFGGELIALDAQLDALRGRFARVRDGFDRLGRTSDVARTGEVIGALDVLQRRLALLGLVLRRRGDHARVVNDLDLSIEVLEEALFALPSTPPLRARTQRVVDDRFGAIDPPRGTVRPPETVQPPRDNPRPSDTVPPPRDGVRPSETIPPPRDGVRPSETIPPPRDGVRPSETIPPPRDGVRPVEGVQPPSGIAP